MQTMKMMVLYLSGDRQHLLASGRYSQRLNNRCEGYCSLSRRIERPKFGKIPPIGRIGARLLRMQPLSLWTKGLACNNDFCICRLRRPFKFCRRPAGGCMDRSIAE